MLPALCPDPTDPCCDCIYTITQALVDAAADAVAACLPVDECELLGRYVSIGRPVGPGDYVAGWLEQLRPAPSRQNTAGAKQVLAPRLLATIGIRLVESGFPTIEVVGGRIALIEYDKLDYAAEHLYGHAEKATRALINELTPACSKGCDSIRFLSSQPSIPAADSVAWEWGFEATLKW